jgi:hypothetical protein
LPHDEDVVAGAAIPCGDRVLVPLLRVRAHAFTAFAGLGEAELIGVVACAGDAPPQLLALDETPSDAAGWNAWLAARPALVAAIRAAVARVS